jgi:hypothetical protein
MCLSLAKSPFISSTRNTPGRHLSRTDVSDFELGCLLRIWNGLAFPPFNNLADSRATSRTVH